MSRHRGISVSLTVVLEAESPLLKSIAIDPVSASDWEIVEINAALVKDNLLNQISVVYTGQRILIWVELEGGAASVVYFKVTSIDNVDATLSVCGRIVRHSEVVIAPRRSC